MFDKLLFAIILVTTLTNPIKGLDNGLTLTPPMGWLAWERFRCIIDCDNDPDNCISERLFMTMADLMVSEGYLDAGYDIISMDDCWMDPQRTPDGKLQPDPKRFPSGLRALSDYIHSKGLRFGIYEDFGNFTCGGYPGIINSMEIDAQTFAEWNADYVKLDGCYADPHIMDEGYPYFGRLLNATGRSMVYSCSWPFYQLYIGMKPNYTLIASSCNLWRNFDDIQDSWESVSSIIDYYGDNQDELIPNAGPGHWNDPDMLIIGNFGLSFEQSRTQMALWAIMASPLIMSNDLRSIRPEFKEILLNRNVIAVNQDRLGIQGRRLSKESGIETWLKPVLPELNNSRSAAVAFVNRRTDGIAYTITTTLRTLGLDLESGYQVQDLFDDNDLGIFLPDDQLQVRVNPTGVVIVKCTVQGKMK